MKTPVTFELAKRLKQMGFTEPTKTYYIDGKLFGPSDPENHNGESITGEKYSAPDVDTAMKFLTDSGIKIALRYTGVFAVMGFRHSVIFCAGYSRQNGLGEDIYGIQSSSKAMMIAELRSKVNKAQLTALRGMMSDRSNGILDSEGNYHAN